MKKLLAVLLCVALVASLGVSAFAATAKQSLSDTVAAKIAGVGEYTKTVDETTLLGYINDDASEITDVEGEDEGAKAAADNAAKEYSTANSALAAAKDFSALLIAQAEAQKAVDDAGDEATAAQKAELADANAKVAAAKAAYDVKFANDENKIDLPEEAEEGDDGEFTVDLTDFEDRVTDAYEQKVVTAAILDVLTSAYGSAKAVADRARAVRKIVTDAKLDENSTVFDYAKVDAAVGQAIANYRLTDAKAWYENEKTYLGDVQSAVKAAIGDVVAIAQANAKVQKTNIEAMFTTLLLLLTSMHLRTSLLKPVQTSLLL